MGGRLLVGGLTALWVLPALGAPAWAHADLARSQPAAGSTMDKPPASIRLDFTETPARSTTALVQDGCGRDVTDNVRRDGTSLQIQVGPARPGQWTVVVAVLSDEDGHAKETRLDFTVRGVPECATATSAPATSRLATSRLATAPPSQESAAPNAGTTALAVGSGKSVAGDGSGARNAVLLGVGGLVLLGGALALRRWQRPGD